MVERSLFTHCTLEVLHKGKEGKLKEVLGYVNVSVVLRTVIRLVAVVSVADSGLAVTQTKESKGMKN